MSIFAKMGKELRKTIPELSYLLTEVEKRYGRRLATSSDFEALSVIIEHESGDVISASTLKRLWGYVTMKPVPRQSTLDVLSRYVGNKNFYSFCQHIKNDNLFESRFFSTKSVLASDLNPGAILIIGWAPDRLVQLEYLGGGEFVVKKSENSKLLENDRFMATCFYIGYPLLIPRILRGGEYTPSYIAGATEGLNRLEIIGGGENVNKQPAQYLNSAAQAPAQDAPVSMKSGSQEPPHTPQEKEQ